MVFNEQAQAKRPKVTSGAMRQPMGADTHLSVCKNCSMTVFSWQQWRWQNRPRATGVVHYNCREAAKR